MRTREEIEGDISEEFLSGSDEIINNSVIKNIEIELLLDIRDLLKEINSEQKNLDDTSSTLCEHIWEQHGCAYPLDKYYICKKCGEEKKIYSTKNEVSNTVYKEKPKVDSMIDTHAEMKSLIDKDYVKDKEVGK